MKTLQEKKQATIANPQNIALYYIMEAQKVLDSQQQEFKIETNQKIEDIQTSLDDAKESILILGYEMENLKTDLPKPFIRAEQIVNECIKALNIERDSLSLKMIKEYNLPKTKEISKKIGRLLRLKKIHVYYEWKKNICSKIEKTEQEIKQEVLMFSTYIGEILARGNMTFKDYIMYSPTYTDIALQEIKKLELKSGIYIDEEKYKDEYIIGIVSKYDTDEYLKWLSKAGMECAKICNEPVNEGVNILYNSFMAFNQNWDKVIRAGLTGEMLSDMIKIMNDEKFLRSIFTKHICSCVNGYDYFNM